MEAISSCSTDAVTVTVSGLLYASTMLPPVKSVSSRTLTIITVPALVV